MGVKNLWDILESCKKTVPLHNLQLTHSFTIFIFNQNLFFPVESCTLLDELTWVCDEFWVAGTKGFVWIYLVGWFSFRMWVNLMLVWKRKFILEDSFTVLELSLLLIVLLFLFQVCFFAFSFCFCFLYVKIAFHCVCVWNFRWMRTRKLCICLHLFYMWNTFVFNLDFVHIHWTRIFILTPRNR
jgi:hypothetical protein